MTTPVELMLDKVAWEVVDNGSRIVGEGDMPYVTHSGVLELLGKDLRCYRLSNGQTVFNADDFEAFWESM